MSTAEGRRRSKGYPYPAIEIPLRRRLTVAEVTINAALDHVLQVPTIRVPVPRGWELEELLEQHGAYVEVNDERGHYMYWVGPENFEGMSDTDLLSWLEAIEATYGEEVAIELGQMAGLSQRLEASGINPEYAAKIRDHVSKSHVRVQAKNMIQDIGEIIGYAADKLVLGTLEPVTHCLGKPVKVPHMEPDLVWKMATAFWHEIVHRGMEIGKKESFWVKGIGEFSYDEVLLFAQHIWEAFLRVTRLDFTVPAESAAIKFWLGLSDKWSDREHAPDIGRLSPEDKKDRLHHYIGYGGPSRALMEEMGIDLDAYAS